MCTSGKALQCHAWQNVLAHMGDTTADRSAVAIIVGMVKAFETVPLHMVWH